MLSENSSWQSCLRYGRKQIEVPQIKLKSVVSKFWIRCILINRQHSEFFSRYFATLQYFIFAHWLTWIDVVFKSCRATLEQALADNRGDSSNPSSRQTSDRVHGTMDAGQIYLVVNLAFGLQKCDYWLWSLQRKENSENWIGQSAKMLKAASESAIQVIEKFKKNQLARKFNIKF